MAWRGVYDTGGVGQRRHVAVEKRTKKGVGQARASQGLSSVEPFLRPAFMRTKKVTGDRPEEKGPHGYFAGPQIHALSFFVFFVFVFCFL